MIKLIQKWLLSIYQNDIASANVLTQESCVPKRSRERSVDLEHINSSSAWVGWTPITDYINGQREIFEGESF